MKSRYLNLKYTVIIIGLLSIGSSALAAGRLPVFVSIAPQKYFVQQIGKERVDVQIMVPPGASPATYEPKPRQMAGISKARVYFAIGAPFERSWLAKIGAANPRMKMVHTEKGVPRVPMEDHHGHGHDSHDHGEGGLDPHIWLSPPLVKIQAGNILAALKQIDPTQAEVYQANHDQFIVALDALDLRLRKIFSDRQGLQFMVFHPSWDYFARTYGLEAVPIEMGGKAPKPAQLEALIAHAREEGIKIVFVQPQFSDRSARLIAREIGGRVAVADPLAEDWMANLNGVADKFNAALK